MLGRPIGNGYERIETFMARASKQCCPCGLVLYQEKERVKLNKEVVIKCELMNR
jgi:hypothetical protein